MLGAGWSDNDDCTDCVPSPRMVDWGGMLQPLTRRRAARDAIGRPPGFRPGAPLQGEWMPTRSAYALLLAAPLSLLATGCTSLLSRPVPRVEQRTLGDQSHTARLMQLAQQYEKQGNREGAERMYQHVLKAQPNHAEARRRSAALAARKPNTAETRDLADAPARAATSTPETRTIRPLVAAPGPKTSERHAPDTARMLATTTTADSDAFAEWTARAEPAAAAELTVDRTERQPESVVEASVATTSAAAEWCHDGNDEQAPEAVNPFAIADGVGHGPFDRDGEPTDEQPPLPPEWPQTGPSRLSPEMPEGFDALLTQLQSSDASTRKAAVTELAILGGAAQPATPALRALLDDGDPLVQAHAAWAVWEIERDGDTAVPVLAALLASQRDDVTQMAAYVLGSIGDDAGAATMALRLLRDGASDATRIHAAEALIRIHPSDEPSIGVLTAALQHDSSEVRWLSAIALGGVAPQQAPRVVTALSAALEDQDPEVCAAAALSLGGLGDAARPAMGVLRRIAEHRDAELRSAALAALACIEP